MARTTIHSADGRLTAILAGAAEAAPEAPLLVCIHGGGCNALYFDLKGFSTVERALARKLPVLLVNRPGHGGSPAARTDLPIEEAAGLIPAFINEVRGERPVVLIGHSIGGAVALVMAAAQPAWPLRALAVSGIGDRIAADFAAAWSDLLSGTAAEPTTAFFFGPDGTFRWNAPAALRRAGEPWQMVEAQDVVSGWPQRFATVAAAVRAPVHLRLAEHERIWETGDEAVTRMAAALGSAAPIDAGVLPDGGHLYELHKRGSELVEGQLDFLTAQAAS